MDEDGLTIAEAAVRCGLTESTRLDAGDVGQPAGGRAEHRRHTHLSGRRPSWGRAGHALFEAHARRLAEELSALELRRRYLDLKVRYWSAREIGDLDKAAVAEELGPIIGSMNPKDTTCPPPAQIGPYTLATYKVFDYFVSYLL